MEFVSIDGVEDGRTDVGADMTSLDLHESELFRNDLPIVGAVRRCGNVVVVNVEKWCACLRCPGVVRERMFARGLLDNSE